MNPIQKKSDNEKAIKTLFDQLFQLLECKSDASKLVALIIRIESDDELTRLNQIGDHIGLHMSRVALTAQAAAEASAASTPLVTRLSDGRGWIILCGFRAGRIRVLMAQGEAVSESRIKVSALHNLLDQSEIRINDWLLVQAKAPLANVVSPEHGGHFSPLSRLIELMRAERSDLMTVLGLTLGSGLLALASPVAVQALVNSVAMAGMGQPLLVLSIILFFFLAFAGVVHVTQSYLVEIVQRRIFVRLATDLAYRLPRVRIEELGQHSGEELVNRFFDVLTVQKSGSALLLDGLSTAVQTCIGLILLAFYHPFLLAFDVILLLAIGFILFILGRGGVATAIKESLSKYALVAWLETIAGNLQTFKFGSGVNHAAKRTDSLALAYLTTKSNHYNVLIKQIIGSVALYAIASTALLAIGGYLVIEGHLTLGQLVAAELIVSSALISLIKFGKHLEGYYDLMAGTDKIGHLLDLSIEREDGVAIDLSKPISVAVQNLSYGFGAKQLVLNNLNFVIEAKEKVALFGPYASGKTLLAEIVCGMRQLQSGTVEIAGHNLEDLRLESIRKHITLVSRIEIIEDSIFENVRLGNTEISLVEVEQALQAVGLLKDVTNYEAGIETVLSTNGNPLSTTQSKLLLLARAIACQPALLIIDSILDEIGEPAMQQVAQTLFADDAPWTLMLMTRSASVAARCERIVSIQGEKHDA
jgi:putative ABC transport system ATP-binding protein